MLIKQKSIHIPVTEINQPCDTCGKQSCNFKWNVQQVNITGVLCRKCLAKIISHINRSLITQSTGEYQKVVIRKFPNKVQR